MITVELCVEIYSYNCYCYMLTVMYALWISTMLCRCRLRYAARNQRKRLIVLSMYCIEWCILLPYILVWYMSAVLYYIIYAVWLCFWHRCHLIRQPIVACIVTALYIVYILCTVYVYVTSCVHELDNCCVCVYQHYMHYIYCTYVYICCMLSHTPLYMLWLMSTPWVSLYVM